MNDNRWMRRGFRELGDVLDTVGQGFYTSALRMRLKVARGSVGQNVRATGRIIVRGTGRIVIEDDVLLDAAACPIELHAKGTAELVIGRGAILDAGVSIESLGSIRIGRNCRIGRFVKMMDSAFHPLRGGDARAWSSEVPPPIPMILEEDVFVGPMAVLLPGTHLEAGVHVEPQKVVSRRLARPQKRVPA